MQPSEKASLHWPSPDTTARLLGYSSLDTVMVYTEPHLDYLAQRMERVEVADSSVET